MSPFGNTVNINISNSNLRGVHSIMDRVPTKYNELGNRYTGDIRARQVQIVKRNLLIIVVIEEVLVDCTGS